MSVEASRAALNAMASSSAVSMTKVSLAITKRCIAVVSARCSGAISWGGASDEIASNAVRRAATTAAI